MVAATYVCGASINMTTYRRTQQWNEVLAWCVYSPYFLDSCIRTFELGNVEGSTNVITIIFVLCSQTPLLVCNPTFSHHSDGPDYRGTEKNLTFPAGTNVVNFTVVIVDDDVNECSKDFFLDLEIPPSAAAMDVVKGSRHNATVTITEEQSGKWCSNAAYATMRHITILCKTHHAQVH